MRTLAGTEEWSDVVTEQRNDRRLAVLRHGHSSSPVQRGSAFPMIALAGSTPKYRPSSESADCQFMTKTSPSARTRQPCQMGSGRPRLSCSRASPTRILSTVMTSRSRQTVCPGKRQDALQQRNAAGQIAAFCEEGCKRFGRQDRDKFGDEEFAGRCVTGRGRSGTLSEAFHI